MVKIAQKMEIDFTDELITCNAGALFLSGMAKQLGLARRIAEAVKLKQRQRGARDEEVLLSLVYSLAQGDGYLCDVDRLGADEARRRLLGLMHVPGSRRVGEYLCRFEHAAVERLRGVAHALAGDVVREVARHEIDRHGYVPVFVDGTAIEVYGEHYEQAGRGYNGQEQYWLHGVWVGRLWASQQLFPGGVDVSHGCEELLGAVAPMVAGVGPVWLRADNAYYERALVDFCMSHGWDYSVSVTSGTYKKPLRRLVEELEESDWTPLDEQGCQSVAWIAHKPAGWAEKQVYVAVRTEVEHGQRLLFPRYHFVLTNRTDLTAQEVIKRHRGKQGQENAQKGPLIDLDLHHPPCKRYEANRAFYTAGQIAQILLCAVQYRLLPEQARQHGIRPIIRDLIRTAGKLTRHARRWCLRFSKSALRLDWIAYAAERLESLDLTPLLMNTA